jgi:hypothetical protein
MSDQHKPVEMVAIMLQRAKTLMETTGIQERYWEVYRDLAATIYKLESKARLNAPALRDQEDEK